MPEVGQLFADVFSYLPTAAADRRKLMDENEDAHQGSIISITLWFLLSTLRTV